MSANLNHKTSTVEVPDSKVSITKPRKSVKNNIPSPIPEEEKPNERSSTSSTNLVEKHKNVKISRETSRISMESEVKSHRKHRKTSEMNKERFAYDNAGFTKSGKDVGGTNQVSTNSDFVRSSSTTASIVSSTRDPSVQSLPVIEQYCCCSRWSQCERILGATIGVLTLIIVILVIVIAVIASQRDDKSLAGAIHSLRLNI